MRLVVLISIISVGLVGHLHAVEASDYSKELRIPYCTVDGKELILTAFLPPKGTKPVPAMVHIHGGWWTGGKPSGAINAQMWAPVRELGFAVFSVQYRLGTNGGFPQNIRDCRNAVRFVRKNAERFNIDPDRIGVMGGSAGGHLTMMTALVPDSFDDGGPTEGLENVSAKVQIAFSWVGPTNLAKQWEDSVTGTPNDAKRYHYVLFHKLRGDTPEGRKEYLRMSPITHVSAKAPPMLICDGELDPIVPGAPGRPLSDALRNAGAEVYYWMTPKGRHGFPSGSSFERRYKHLLDRLKN
jgi:acetyl esterase/lipase